MTDECFIAGFQVPYESVGSSSNKSFNGKENFRNR
jgi:hypothetical protein